LKHEWQIVAYIFTALVYLDKLERSDFALFLLYPCVASCTCDFYLHI
jgi:hypothetical protein